MFNYHDISIKITNYINTNEIHFEFNYTSECLVTYKVKVKFNEMYNY